MALGYREHAAEFTERNVVLFGIHDGSLDAARQWVEKEQLPFAVLNDPDRRVGIELGMSALDGERYVKDPSDGKRPAVVIDEHSVICEWESDMNHTDQIAQSYWSVCRTTSTVRAFRLLPALVQTAKRGSARTVA